jgi:hypothetical protein
VAQIKSFGVQQTATFAAAHSLIPWVVMLIPTALVAAGSGGQQGSVLVALLILLVGPVVMAVVTFISVLMMCFIYNLVTSFIGGIEVEIE